jgi:hypothetical protein
MGVIQQFLVKDDAGMTKLALAVRKHQGTVQRWINNGRIPVANDRLKVALACGCSEEEALALASESSIEAKESA